MQLHMRTRTQLLADVRAKLRDRISSYTSGTIYITAVATA